MKKGLILVVAVIILGVGYLQFGNNTSQDSVPVEADAVQNDSAMMDESMEKTDDTMMEESNTYAVQSESRASYVVQKEWFGKPSETIVGTSSEVNGSVVYDAEMQVLESIDIVLNTASLSSGSDGRDKEVVELLGKNIRISTSASVSDIAPEDVSLTLPLDVTINGQTNTINFDVTGTVSDTMIDVSGSATANIAEFGVKAPSLLGVYTVAEEMNLNFDLKASK